MLSCPRQTQATGLLAKASHLLSRRNTLYVTRVVDNLCTSKPNSEDDTYLYLDPKVSRQHPSGKSRKEGGLPTSS